MLRERRALRRARHVVPAAQELGLRPAARSKARVVRELLSRGMDGCVSPACGQLNRCDRGHLQSSVPSRVPLLESRSPIITSAIEALVPLELRPFSPSRLVKEFRLGVASAALTKVSRHPPGVKIAEPTSTHAIVQTRRGAWITRGAPTPPAPAPNAFQSLFLSSWSRREMSSFTPTRTFSPSWPPLVARSPS